ncbi:Cell filamentation protein fic [Bifidobacterium bifidum]|nr:Cell filamentation protein fic [Bifidobacterium bifidum]
MQWIHRQLFRDVYDWAGEIRVIDMAKGDGEPFQPLELFDMGVIYSERMLREDNLLRGLPFETFIDGLSVSYNNFNILHPFREGNGRAQRVFWDVVARDAGWHFDWGLVGRRENDPASIAAMRSNDLGPLEQMFARITKPPAEPLATGVRFSHLMDGEYQEQPNVGYRLSKGDYQTLRVKYSYQMPQE